MGEALDVFDPFLESPASWSVVDDLADRVQITGQPVRRRTQEFECQFCDGKHGPKALWHWPDNMGNADDREALPAPIRVSADCIGHGDGGDNALTMSRSRSRWPVTRSHPLPVEAMAGENNLSKVHRLELRQLRYFVAAAEAGSLRKAAQQLNISQPPLGRQIAQLEEELGVLLFGRTKRGLIITEAGLELLIHAQALISRLEFAIEQVEDVSRGLTGQVRAEYSDDFAYGVVPNAITKFIEESNSLNVSFNLSRCQEIIKKVLDREIDIGFVVYPLPAIASPLMSHMLQPVGLYVALPDSHVLSKRKSVSIDELSNEIFLSSSIDPTSAFFIQRSQLLREASISPELRLGFWPTSMFMNMVERGVGVAVLCRDSVPAHLPGVCLIPLAGPAATLNRCMIWQKSPRPSVAHFIESMKETL